MLTVKIKNIEIGHGMPKMCVPLVGAKREDILQEIAMLKNVACDIVEWRADYYGDTLNISETLSLLSEISGLLKKKVLLFTFRTAKEGGAKQISPENYRILNERVINSGNADIVDIELFIGTDIVKELVYNANQKSVFVMMSNHDFEKTPGKETMLARLCKMHELGADIAKIAVMPLTKKDVAALIEVMVEMDECYAVKPFCAISMARLGFVSRIIGEAFGSCITFGALGAPSAPGQICANDLHMLLKMIHNSV